jgi:hypothetical protein
LFGGAGVGKTVFIQELIVCHPYTPPLLTSCTEQRRQGPWRLLCLHRCR